MKDKDLKIAATKIFLKQKPNATIRHVVEVVGLDLFSNLLFHPGLQQKHLVFPSRSTLQRMLIAARIRNELRYLKPGSKNFKSKVSMLSKLYGLRPFRILKIFEGTK